MFVWVLTLKIACRVRRWRSVKTSRGFLGAGCWCSAWFAISSFLLHAEIRGIREDPWTIRVRSISRALLDNRVDARHARILICYCMLIFRIVLKVFKSLADKMRDNYALKLIIASSFGRLLMIFPHDKVVFPVKCRSVIRWELMDFRFVHSKITKYPTI